MSAVIILLVFGLILFVSFYGKDEARAQLDEKRKWRVRNEGGTFVYQQKSGEQWLSLELESIRSAEDYGIYGLRIWPVPEWSTRVPEWAKGQREVVADRVKEEFPSIRIIR